MTSEPHGSYYNTDPYWERFLLPWSREKAPTTVPAHLKVEGWLPIAEVPTDKYVALYFRDGMVGDYAGSGAYYLEKNRWHVAESHLIFDASHAIAWKRWTKQSLKAEATPPKGRRG